MQQHRLELINDNIDFISSRYELLRSNLADGPSTIRTEIDPYIEECKTKEQLELFKMCRYYWSSPYSNHVGRRMEVIVRDRAVSNHPIIGIGALGSPVMHIPTRDKYIGWDKNNRYKKLIYTASLYVCGAMPPYNDLLGGKLMAYIMSSSKVLDMYKAKYSVLSPRRHNSINQLACIFTSGLFGRSSQYN
ncbi:Druantia anti-phage system protein DruA, partial [Oenococcus oeni]